MSSEQGYQYKIEWRYCPNFGHANTCVTLMALPPNFHQLLYMALESSLQLPWAQAYLNPAEQWAPCLHRPSEFLGRTVWPTHSETKSWLHLLFGIPLKTCSYAPTTISIRSGAADGKVGICFGFISLLLRLPRSPWVIIFLEFRNAANHTPALLFLP